ncbi:MAG: SAM-dependent DNA methyltransferase, partial [Chloroflexia bacterium]|nr:SAM-dependent DNA methyltransferase [Chloroflexia bacterium]
MPYLARGKQSDALKTYCERHYPEAKNDLANVFLERCLELCVDAASSRVETRQDGASTGVVQIVMPQNWLFLGSYRKQRESLLRRVQWNLLARLGMAAFEIMDWWAFNVILITQTNALTGVDFQVRGVDVSAMKGAEKKAALLRENSVLVVSQIGQLGNPDARVTLTDAASGELLEKFAEGLNGMHGGDSLRFRLMFWEMNDLANWAFFHCTCDETQYFGGLEHVFFWANDGLIHHENPRAYVKGKSVWGRWGVAVSMMRKLPVTIYTGEKFDISCTPIVPHNPDDLGAIWCFCSSPEYHEAVRQIDQKLNVTNATLAKVPFDLPHWQQVAAERYPNGLPKPYSDDPTQWIFHGHPQPATDPLQVAVARLLGYRWPAETDAEMELADEARAWIARCEALAEHVDDDGIVCLSSVRGEPPAADRLLALLIAAWETVEPGSWRPSILDRLLADAGCAGKGLDIWLRDSFFEQHAKRFHHRPFIWHVWDG